MADAMGHSLEVHMGNYARFMTRDLASAFEAANGVTPAPVSLGGSSSHGHHKAGRLISPPLSM